MKKRTFLLTALEIEARSLIAQLSLQEVRGISPFRIYENDKFLLVISGIGKLRAAAAVGFVLAKYPERDSIWINVGLAGHLDAPIGKGHLIHKVTDAASGGSYYPQSFLKKLPSHSLLTLDAPSFSYKKEALYDMEGYGFYSAAVLASSVEFIHCYKIISDNATSPFPKGDKAFVLGLMEENVEPIKNLIEFLSAKQSNWLDASKLPEGWEEIFTKVHFTETEKHEYKKLLKKYFVFFKALPQDTLGSSAKECLSSLEKKISCEPLVF